MVHLFLAVTLTFPAIERLHQQDVAATLSGKADDLAQLWDMDAVRIMPGRPAENGKATIVANDKRWEAEGGGPAQCYVSEIQQVEVTGDDAYEWGYFSYKEKADSAPIRGKVVRTMKRQSNGSWKFTLVMGFSEKSDAAAPMNHPCK